MPYDATTDHLPPLSSLFDRVRQWDPVLDAWAHLEDPAVLAAAIDLQTATNPAAPLLGVPFGVKDVIDVAGQPTRFGSAVFAKAGPAAADAVIVAALRAAGAIPVGKTRTTEFAFTDPTTTRNPHNPRHSPGGSSSGSGAVVGAGLVPFALGTQTAGSLCRPATYCGAAAYKPGLGVLPTGGIAPLSRSFDAVGIIAGSADWLSRIFDVLVQAFPIPAGPRYQPGPRNPLRIGFVSVFGQFPDPDMAATMQQTVAALRTAGHQVVDMPTPVPFAEITARHRTVMLAEAARDLIPLVSGHEDQLQPRLRAALQAGAQIPADDVADALTWLVAARLAFWGHYTACDLLLAYPVPGAAPPDLRTTGDQSYLTPWTAMAGPLVSLPAGCDRHGLPLGILLAAAPGRDAFVIDAARAIAGLQSPCPPPVMPVPAAEIIG